MILTRCPNCSTVFRVTPEQLRVRHGQVRCGSCFATFNALAELTEEAPPPGAVPAPGDTLQPPATPFATGLEEAPTVSDVPPESLETPDLGQEPAAEDIEFIDIGVPAGSEEQDVELEVVEVASQGESSREPPVESSREPLPEAAPAQEAPPEPEPDRLAEPQPEPAPETTTENPVAVAADQRPQHLEAAREPRHWLWWSAAAIALAALVLQVIVHLRTDLAIRYPEARPALEAVCAQIGCDIPLPAKIGLLEIEHSDLVPDERNAGRLLLSATLRNLAGHAQTWPHLELTLTDAHDRPLTRRALAPGDYLPSADAIAPGFPARGEQQVQLEVRAAGVPAVGYRLYLFYP